MFRCVIDSDWVLVHPLTAIVGKNESGKTTLLKALHRFNPFHSEPYVLNRDWPRGERDKKDPKQVVCTARFSLDDDEVNALSGIAGKPLNARTIEVTKNYAGEFEIVVPADVFPEKLHPNAIDTAVKQLPSLPADVGEAYSKAAKGVIEEANRFAAEGRFSNIQSLADSAATRLNAAMSPAEMQPHRDNETAFTTSLTERLRAVARQLSDTPTIQHQAHEFVVKRIPTFVYMDEYRTFSGTALLDQVSARQKKTPQAGDETLLTILALSGLSIEDLVAKGSSANEAEKEERQYDLSDGAATLKRRIEGHWGQLRYDIEFTADGQQFFTFIRDPKDKALIRLEERSRGFQWFFSFDLLLMHQTRGTFRGCVILLDEPGLHLHPEGQRDLLRRLDEYAKGNVLIYSTHLPFMIDLQEPDRIRVLSESESGTHVTDDLGQSQPEGRLTLQAALGISGRTSFLLAHENLVVEGVDDFWILSALSDLAIRSNKQGLPQGVMVTAAGGASEVTYIATFMVGQELGVVALYDSDTAGDVAKEKFTHKWLARYKGRSAVALSLGEAVQVKGHLSIEDLFDQDYYVKHVCGVYGKQLAAVGIDKLELPQGTMLCKRVEQVFESQSLTFNKGSVAKRIAAEIRGMKGWTELPTITQQRAELLFAAIAAATEKLGTSPGHSDSST